MAETLREKSKRTWTNDSGTHEAINCGSLQRIADATELMARNHLSLQADRDLYEKWYRDEQKKRRKLEKSNAALRGVIGHMKRNARA